MMREIFFIRIDDSLLGVSDENHVALHVEKGVWLALPRWLHKETFTETILPEATFWAIVSAALQVFPSAKGVDYSIIDE